MSATTMLWEPLERRSKTVFLVAGVLLAGYAVSKAIYTFTGVTPIGAFDVAFGGTGLLVTMLALLGLYSRTRDGAPWVSLAGALVTVIGAVGTLALLGWLAGATLTRAGYPAIPEEAPAWTGAIFFLVFISLVLGFLLSVGASLRTDDLSGTVSLLLLVPALSFLGLIVANVLFPPGQYIGVLVYVPTSLALLAIGSLLRTEPVQNETVESASDSVA